MTELIEGVVLPPDTWTPEQAAGYITEAWQSAVSSIVETGRRLTEVKERVGHGNWLPTVELLPFGDSTARKLMQIAAHPDLSNQEHVTDLPASWGTLSVLAQLPPGEIPRRIQAREITAEIQRAAAEQITVACEAERLERLRQMADEAERANPYVPIRELVDVRDALRRAVPKMRALKDAGQSIGADALIAGIASLYKELEELL